MRLMPYEHNHNNRLVEIAKISEPWFTYNADTFNADRTGFVILNNENKIVGSSLFSDYFVGADITIHNMVLPEYFGRWITRSIYKEVFDYPFVSLGLERCSTYIIDGFTDPKAVERAGFTQEGIKRKLVEVDGVKRDVILYGMLKHERKW